MTKRREVTVLIVSGACCSPVLRGADEQASALVARVATEEGVSVDTRVVSITAVLVGAIPARIVERSREAFERAGRALPGVIVDGEPACFGPLDERAIRERLVQAGADAERRPHVHA